VEFDDENRTPFALGETFTLPLALPIVILLPLKLNSPFNELSSL
jgi:hypothetical protein